MQIVQNWETEFDFSQNYSPFFLFAFPNVIFYNDTDVAKGSKRHGEESHENSWNWRGQAWNSASCAEIKACFGKKWRVSSVSVSISFHFCGDSISVKNFFLFKSSSVFWGRGVSLDVPGQVSVQNRVANCYFGWNWIPPDNIFCCGVTFKISKTVLVNFWTLILFPEDFRSVQANLQPKPIAGAEFGPENRPLLEIFTSYIMLSL